MLGGFLGSGEVVRCGYVVYLRRMCADVVECGVDMR
jgi:hypothetical protein